MFWEEYGPYVLIGFGIGVLLILLFIAEALVVRANRRFLRESSKEMAELLTLAGRTAEAKAVEEDMDRVLGRQLQDAAGRWKRRKELRKRRS